MDLFDRFRNIVRGKAYKALEQLEDPSEQLDVITADLNREIEEQREAVARAMADEKRIRLEIEELLHQGSEWEKRAAFAVKNGDEKLAQEALFRKQDCEGRALGMQAGWKKQHEATAKLRESLVRNRGKVDEIRREYSLLVAQYKTAEANRNVAGALNASGSKSAGAMMERLQDKIRIIEASAQADLDLSGDAADADLTAKFAELERRERGTKSMDELRKKMESGKVGQHDDESELGRLRKSVSGG
jgi:phage shock protein A